MDVYNRYVLPSFVERTSYGIKESNPYNKMFEERIIFLGVQIDDASANDVIAQLIALESMDPDRDVTMYINSPGGSVTSMMAIYDTMQFVQPEIATVCIGQAASAAEKESNREAAQYAAIGLVRMKMRNRSRLLPAIAEVTQIAESAVSPGVAASAWLLVGQARIAMKDPKAAAKAYAEAYKNAPKPSAIADAARRGLEATGAPTPEEIASAASGEMRLIYPRRPVQVGWLDVIAAAPASAARVEFILDDQNAFTAHLCFGAWTVYFHLLQAEGGWCNAELWFRNVVLSSRRLLLAAPHGRQPRLVRHLVQGADLILPAPHPSPALALPPLLQPRGRSRHRQCDQHSRGKGGHHKYEKSALHPHAPSGGARSPKC